MAKQQVTVPDIGGAEGAEVIELLVAVGDRIEVDQSLIVLESDKASMEIPSSLAGEVLEILVKEGDELAEGSPIALLETGGGGDSAEPEPELESTAEPEPESSAESVQAEEAPAAAAPASDPTGAETITVEVPDIGTDEAVDLIELSVQVGDTVAEGDSLVVLESDKASMEVPSPHAGEVVAWLAEEGAEVRQGDALLTLKVAGGSRPADSAASTEAEKSPAPEQSAAAPAQAAPAEPDAPSAKPVPAPPAAKGGEVYAGPAVRKLGRELGVSLDEVKGSGPRGRVLKEDVQAFVKSALAGKTAAPGAVTSGTGIPPIPEVDFAAFGPVEAVTRSRLDKLTAANMQRSWLNVPHVTQFEEADITELEEFRSSLKSEAEKRGTRLTPMPFLLKAVAAALRDNPKFCASLSADGEELVYKHYTHIGMAVDTPVGLVVPVIRDVDQKSVWQLAEEVLDLAARARDRKLKPAEMQGGCFTISSLGNIGGRGFTPIVNAPEVGILGVSRAEIRPVWDGAEFQPRKLLPLSLSYDHRVINGSDAGRFCVHLVSLLADIRRLVL